MDSFSVVFAIIALAVFGLTVIAERILIPILHSHRIGQVIYDLGPRWHKNKEGVPTMGGIGFILPILLVTAAWFVVMGVRGNASDYVPLASVLIFGVCNGAIGFVDDYCKLVKKQNEGLTAKQKLFLQFVIAAAYVCVMSYMGYTDTAIALPFTDAEWELGWLWYPLAVLLLAGVVNGCNLTDGLDGLASSVTFVIGGFFAVWAFALRDTSLSLVSAILLGATLGFLVYNFHPAKVFMGDTGSLFLGAIVISASFMMNEEFVGLIIAGVYVVEMLSSFLQTTVFKITKRICRDRRGRRIFKMAPLHHHFEKCGWGEYAVVALFSALAVLFCTLAWFSL